MLCRIDHPRSRTQLEWSDNGYLKVTNYHPGYLVDEETGEKVWWNIAHTGSLKTADGTPFPKKIVAEIQRRGWEDTYAFKVRPCRTSPSQEHHRGLARAAHEPRTRASRAVCCSCCSDAGLALHPCLAQSPPPGP